MNKQQTQTVKPIVYIVDSDAAVRNQLDTLLVGLKVDVKLFASAEALLAAPPLQHLGCVIAEVHLPGIDGLELLSTLRQRGVTTPMVLLASDSNVPLAVRAMRAGVIDFIDKPFVDQVLLSRVRQALKQ